MARSHYVFTHNNYTDEDVTRYLTPNARINYMVFGYEQAPTTGTPHLQGYFQTTIRETGRLNKIFPSAYITKAKGSSDEASQYCKKGGQFEEVGDMITIERKQPGKREDLSELKKEIDNGATWDTLTQTHFENCAKYGRFIKDLIQERDYTKGLNSLREAFASASLLPWQQALLEVTQENPCPRKIHWLWDRKGNSGKSWMTSYLAAMHNATVLSTGKKADLAYIWATKICRIAVFDLARTSEEYLNSVYSLAEDLKNGRVISTKYESKTVLFPVPHVICFANFTPDMTKWSQDRYNVIEIK